MLTGGLQYTPAFLHCASLVHCIVGDWHVQPLAPHVGVALPEQVGFTLPEKQQYVWTVKASIIPGNGRIGSSHASKRVHHARTELSNELAVRA